MNSALDPEDARLDVLWRRRFGQPLPIRGCASLALAILGEEAAFAEPGSAAGGGGHMLENAQLGMV